MPRGSFKHEDASQGGAGFQEGNVQVIKSVVAVHQFPPNSKTNKQSDAFCAMRWTLKKLDSEWNELSGDEADTIVVLPIRLGTLDQMRPGKLAPKDFDNLDVEPEDLGDEVDTEGNALFMTDGAKAGRGWAIMEESLRKAGFKPEISGRGIARDFEGMVAHFKTVEGQKYIAKQGEKKGQEVTPSNLVCDRIHTYPYDKKKGGAGAGSSTGSVKAAPASSGAGASSGSGAGSADDAIATAVSVFNQLSNEFKKEIPAGKEVDRAAFQKAVTRELMRQKMPPKLQKSVQDLVKNDERLTELAMALVDQPGAFSHDGEKVTFG